MEFRKEGILILGIDKPNGAYIGISRGRSSDQDHQDAISDH